MKSHDSWSPPPAGFPAVLRLAGGVAAACALLAAAPALAETTLVSAASTTLFRIGHGDFQDSKNIDTAYEYLRLSVSRTFNGGDSLSFLAGGWLRGDLGDKSANDRYTDADLQYGYLSYQRGRNNQVVNAGRQLVTEGVATERLDGLYLRSDLPAGFAAAIFVGSPVVTEPNFKADNLVFGGRFTHSLSNYYTLGVSALKSYQDSTRYREEEGVDLWLHPVRGVDITGRSSYNSLTDGWMEHSYRASYAPLSPLRLFANLESINYRDYFYRVTTSALSFTNRLIDPNEKMLALGGGASFTPLDSLTLSAEYRHYDYDIAGAANYYGGRIGYANPKYLSCGVAVYRMDGAADRLKYLEYRAYAAKSIGKADLALDLIDVRYDSTLATNQVKDAFTASAALTYRWDDRLSFGGDIDYSHNPDFDNEVRGLLKLSYAFEAKRAAEGGAK
ncbi:hypothetical protein GMST_20200 [Geomonas silvestris]|uniref:Outer membrane channel protein n=1 Tax=Geomonas silvestris TaxID=2740184 RepID=A0A6V8MI60_9BACT|nr:hypothetical protein [Geomonas silvestris]GFO59695.1 hypothetical protein GMST_20200 [Geomonas silvestris]